MKVRFLQFFDINKLTHISRYYGLLLSILLVIIVIIGCTQFNSGSPDIDDNADRLGQEDLPQPEQKAVLPAPPTATSEDVIFAPVLMDNSETQAQPENIAALLSQTVTTTVATTSQVTTSEVTTSLEITPTRQFIRPTPALTVAASSVTTETVDTPIADMEATPEPLLQEEVSPTPTSQISVTLNGITSTEELTVTAVPSSVLTTTVFTQTEVTGVVSHSVGVEEAGIPAFSNENLDDGKQQEGETDESIRVERTVKVPILMYHYLSVPPADADIYRLDLSVTPEQFSRHLDAMLDAGYTTVSLFDLWNHLENGVDLPPKPVVLTFDDGYLDNYENAFPLLIQRGMTATFFIVTGFIEEGRGGYINWQMVEEMYDAGMSIESHSTQHFSLKNRDDEFLTFEALRTKEIIEAKLGVAPRFISYPAGEYDQNTIDVFRSAGYLMGVTTIQGSAHSNDNYFELRRVRVRGTTDEAQLLELLEIDW